MQKNDLPTDTPRKKHLGGFSTLKRMAIVMATCLFTVSFTFNDTASAEEWQFMAEAYFWYASIGGESSDGGDIQLDNNDLVDALDFGFMVAVGAKKDKLSFLVDTIYLDVSDSSSNFVDNVGVNTKVELSGLIITPMVGYEVYENDKTELNVIVGARYLYLSTDVTLRRVGIVIDSVSDSGNNWDAIVGIKGDYFINDNWFVPYYADIGAGNSQFTWQVLGGIGYRFDMCDVVATYRYLDWNFDDNDVFDDLNISGFTAGVRFFF